MFSNTLTTNYCHDFFFQAKDREDAKALFKTRQGKDQLKEIRRRAKTFTPGEGEDGPASGRPATNASGLTPEQVRNGTLLI